MVLASNQKERSGRQAHLQQAEADVEPLPFDTAAARSLGQVAAGSRRAGRKPAARAYDAMIAAIAISNVLPIHTCNPRDFSGIEGLTQVAVPHPDHLQRTIAVTTTNPGCAVLLGSRAHAVLPGMS